MENSTQAGIRALTGPVVLPRRLHASPALASSSALQTYRPTTSIHTKVGGSRHTERGAVHLEKLPSMSCPHSGDGDRSRCTPAGTLELRLELGLWLASGVAGELHSSAFLPFPGSAPLSLHLMHGPTQERQSQVIFHEQLDLAVTSADGCRSSAATGRTTPQEDLSRAAAVRGAPPGQSDVCGCRQHGWPGQLA